MSVFQIDADEGFTDVQVATPEGTATARIDVFEGRNAYAALLIKHPDDAVALGAAWCDWLAGKGLPGLSHGAAFRLADHVSAEVEAYKKKGPGSPSAG